MATFWERAVRSVDPRFSCIMNTCNFSYFPFEDRIWILIAPVPDHCLLVAFIHFKKSLYFTARSIAQNDFFKL